MHKDQVRAIVSMLDAIRLEARAREYETGHGVKVVAEGKAALMNEAETKVARAYRLIGGENDTTPRGMPGN